MTTRIFQPCPLTAKNVIQLNEAASHHLTRVLRANMGDEIIIFNGEGGEYTATITQIEKKFVSVAIKEYSARSAESPLHICLAQGISRGEKMDYTIQKAVELGVKEIVPLFTERCNVKLDAERSVKRLQHWQAIAISACEQSGRNIIPQIYAPHTLSALTKFANYQGVILAPDAIHSLNGLALEKNCKIILLVGPEGGLSAQEIEQMRQQGYTSLQLGPRILRTETAALVAISALQYVAGDLC